MDSMQMITYLLLGVAGLGALLGVIVLLMALFPPKLEEYDQQDDLGEFEGDTRLHAPYGAQFSTEEPPQEESPPEEAMGIPLADVVIAAPAETRTADPASNEGETAAAGEQASTEEDAEQTVQAGEADAVSAAEPGDEAEAPEDAPPVEKAAQATDEPAVKEEPEEPAAESAPQPPISKGEMADTASIQVTDGRMQVGRWTLRLSSAQDIGARAEQQDAFEIGPRDAQALKEHGLICALCDGMGGMRMGGEAARIAARSFVQAVAAAKGDVVNAMQDAAEMANDRVWALCKSDDLSGAGTTLAAAIIDENGLNFLSVGDSHVYLMRGDRLSQLNVDHNYLAELLARVRRGEITRQQALTDPERAHLTSYLGMKRIAMIDQNRQPIALKAGDRVVLASDGLFKVLSPEEIEDVIRTFASDCASRLIDEALRRRYRNQDNISVIVVAVE